MPVTLSTAAWQLDKQQGEPHRSARMFIAAAEGSDLDAACYRLGLVELHTPSPTPWKALLRACSRSGAIHKSHSTFGPRIPMSIPPPHPLIPLPIPQARRRHRYATAHPLGLPKQQGTGRAPPSSAEQLCPPHGGRQRPAGVPVRGRAGSAVRAGPLGTHMVRGERGRAAPGRLPGGSGALPSLLSSKDGFPLGAAASSLLVL